jgi:pimeloyl-ACP methyl ester carboxylesterase
MRAVRIVAIVIVACLATPLLHAQRYENFTIPRPLPENSILVVGILGGIEHWDSDARPVNRLAADLRARAIPNVYVITVEHKHRGLVRRVILEALDQNKDGRLDAQECAAARLILYGHSMGGAGVVKLARELEKENVPVLLTVQVDSVGASDRDIPANVARAANFFERNSSQPWLRGEPDIRAVDSAKTTILGNFQYDYKKKDIDLSSVNPVERAAGGAHTKMEWDPAVWSAVEKLILKEIAEQQPKPPAPL